MVEVRPRGWWFDAACVAAFAALTAALAAGPLLPLDLAVADAADAARPPAVYWTLRVLNYLGQGGLILTPVAALLAAAAARRHRSARPVLVVAAAFALTYLTIGPLKVLFDRAAPHFAGPDRAVLFNPAADGALALSYPSGHVANALVWYWVIALLAGSLRGRPVPAALRAVPPVIVFVTTTWLAFHWISDSVAGLLLGLVLTRLLARVPWDEVPLPGAVGRWRRPAGLTPSAHRASPG